MIKEHFKKEFIKFKNWDVEVVKFRKSSFENKIKRSFKIDSNSFESGI